MKSITSQIRSIIRAIEGPEIRQDLYDTPQRVQRAFEEIFNGYEVDIPGLFKVFEEDGKDEIVILRNIHFWSTCEHHLLTWEGYASVAYLPQEKVVGASKLARLVEAYAHRLQLQERVGRQVAEAMMKYLNPRGVAVVIKGKHSCISCRGVRNETSELVTSVMLGAFRENAASRYEVLKLIGDI